VDVGGNKERAKEEGDGEGGGEGEEYTTEEAPGESSPLVSGSFSSGMRPRSPFIRILGRAGGLLGFKKKSIRTRKEDGR
jgi:hypothetical protein